MKHNNYKLLSLIIVFFLSTCISYSQTGHWEQLHPKTNPGARSRHDMAPIGDNKVLLFGGDLNDRGDQNDTWIFDLVQGDWKQINCKNSPLPREEFSMTQISEKKVLLFGGDNMYSANMDIYSDLWMFDLDSMDWQEITPQNKIPKSFGHRMVKFINNHVFVFGGMEEYYPTGDFISNVSRIYSLDSNKWITVSEERRVVSPRMNFNMTTIGDSLVFMFGGWNYKYVNENRFCKALSSDLILKWDSLPSLNNQNIYNDGGDMKHIRNGIVILFGGETLFDSIGYGDITMIFDYNGNRKWKILNLSLHPSYRSWHKMSVIDTNKILLYGGFGGDKSHNDTWLFVLDSCPTSVFEIEKETENLLIYQLSDNELEIKNIKNENTYSELIIYDYRGLLCYQLNNNYSNQINVDISNFDTGVYYLIINIGINCYRDRIIIVK